MSQSHTPGPWTFGHSGRETLWVGPSHDLLNVATVDWDCATAREEARANARLIAAAPELLEALRAMHDKTAELIAHLQATDRLRPCFNLPALDAASAAIAKATGGAL